MSRIGKLPVNLPKNITAKKEKNSIAIKGPKGELSIKTFDCLKYKIEEDKITIEPVKKGDKEIYALWGLSRKLIDNAVTGVIDGFKKELQIVGAGYKAKLQGKKLVLNIGFSHPVEIEPPENIEFKVTDPLNFTISGIDKQKVGQVAADIRNLKPPEPYKLKGIRYKDEQLIKKERKLAVGVE